MNLNQWMLINRWSRKAMANKLYITPTSLSSWAIGRRIPNCHNIGRIAEFTKGQVLEQDFIDGHKEYLKFQNDKNNN